MKRQILYLFMLLATAFVSIEASAQGVTSANILGLITDENRGAIPGATVIAVHEPSGSQYGAVTLSDGRFHLPNVRVGGPYTITVSFIGYKDAVQREVFLELGQTHDANFALAETTVELSGVEITADDDVVINSDRTGAATNINNETIKNLPSINRSLQDFTRLTPQASGNSFAGRSDLYNNLTIDGSNFNNQFGLSGLPGGQTNSQPISLDAVDQIQVNLAPYDVRQGGFTGSGINAVTKSGDNEIRGSVYYFFRNDGLLSDRIGNTTNKVSKFDYSQIGARIGGPIVKNKLFYFLSYEQETRTDPGSLFQANDGTGGPTQSLARASDLDALKGFLGSAYGYNPGNYQGYNLNTSSEKYLVKLDWNINSKNRFSIRYNYLRSDRDLPPSNSTPNIGGAGGNRQASATALPFSGSNYNIQNNISSLVAELNSRIGSKFTNTFTVAWTTFRDSRLNKVFSSFVPFVDILNGGQIATSFGFEPFSPANYVDQDNLQIIDNLTGYFGKHTITAGISFEAFAFRNSFFPGSQSYYRFNSYADFYNASPAGTATPLGTSTGAGRPSAFSLQYATDGTGSPNGKIQLANTDVRYFGFYVQDEWQARTNLKVTVGLRADIPFLSADVPRNNYIDGLIFNDGKDIRTDQLPSGNLLWSPRVGFNWDVFNNKQTQIRGGSGLFTGRPAFVWISNQTSNTGVTSATISTSTNAPAGLTAFPYSTNPGQYIPAAGSAPTSFILNNTDNKFNFPQIWRTNIAIDQKLPGGIVGTLEAIYSKNVNEVLYQDISLRDAPRGYTPIRGSSDIRPVYQNVGTTTTTVNGVAFNALAANTQRLYTNVAGAYKLTNTDQGYQFLITAQLRKDFKEGALRGLGASFAYTYADIKDLSSAGSIAGSSFNGVQQAGNPNQLGLSNSNFAFKHRIVSTVSYRKEYANNFASTLSLVYVWSQANPVSYTYTNDANGDGVGNDLFYIPRSSDEIILVPTAAGDTRTSAQLYDVLNTFITQSDYLNDNRGKIAERNGAFAPPVGRLDLRFMQDFYINIGGKRNTLQFTMDIINFGNLINSAFGVERVPRFTSLLAFRGVNPAGQPVYSLPGNELQGSPFVESGSLANRWQMQFGLRYIFN
jgi:Carboxypeptidase regulatory-like domain